MSADLDDFTSWSTRFWHNSLACVIARCDSRCGMTCCCGRSTVFRKNHCRAHSIATFVLVLAPQVPVHQKLTVNILVSSIVLRCEIVAHLGDENSWWPSLLTINDFRAPSRRCALCKYKSNLGSIQAFHFSTARSMSSKKSITLRASHAYERWYNGTTRLLSRSR